MAVKINGDLVPDAAIEFELSRIVRFYSEHMNETELRAQMEQFKAKARQQAIGAKLLIIEASRLDLKVPDEYVEEKLSEMQKECGGEDGFIKMLETQNATEEMVKQNISDGHRVDMLVEKVTSEASEPAEDEMKAHFEAHADEYKKPERAEAQHILVKPESEDDEGKKAAEASLQDIRKRLNAGSSFADEAGAHSECPSGKSAGGSLGWFSRGMMVPEFDEVVFSMAVGDVSDIVETDFGLHLISKTGHEHPEAASYEEVSENVREFLRHVKRGEVLSSYVEDLKGKATIEEA
jgi:parvulin-like peptidyl-prolyl isomerase